MKLPEKKRPGLPIRAEDWNALIDAISARTIMPGTGFELVQTNRGFTLRIQRQKGTVAESLPCSFGSLVSISSGETTVQAIRGGIVHAGDTNWTVDDTAIPTSDGTHHAYLEAVVEVNRDDDNEVLLPGVLTGVSISEITFTTGAIPNDVQPAVSTGIGTVILYIGQIVVADGIATFWPEGCGAFTVGHCLGTLSSNRSNGAPA